MKYPECEKMKNAAPQSQNLSEFLDWLRDDKGIWLMHSVKNSEDKERDAIVIQNNESLLAEFFGIDLKKVEKERRAILKEACKKL